MACSYSPTIPLSLTRACSRAAVKPSQSLHLRVAFSSPSVYYRASFPLSHKQTLSLLPNSLPSLKPHCVSDSKAPVVTQDSWEKEVLKSETPVLVEFYASWCGPCRMVHRVIDEIAEEYAGRLKCVLLNTDDDSQIAEEHEIKAVPVVLIFKDGKRREIVAGTMPKDFYVSAIERVLNPTSATSSQ